MLVMDVNPASWITSTQALVVAITGLIASVPPLITAIPTVIRAIRPHSSDNQGQERAKQGLLRWPAVLGLCLLTAAVALFGARLLTQTRLPVNARLANEAWNAFVKHNYDQAFQTASDCVAQFGDQAEAQQAKLVADHTPSPAVGSVADPEKTLLLGRGVLNDAGACLFVKAQAADRMGKTGDARSFYEQLSKLTYARVYDPAGYFWSPADAASAWLKKTQ
jgi:hypothetical protein